MKSQFPTDKHFRQCVGIDVSKNKFTACLCMQSWGCPAQFTESIDFANTKTGFNQLVKWARREAEKGFPILFLMEFTGTYYQALAYHLNKLSFTVYVLSPNRVKGFFKEEGVKTKTDAVDARVLALMGSNKPNLKSWAPPSSKYKELRQLTRLGVNFTETLVMFKNIREGLIHQYGTSAEAIKQVDKLIKSIQLRIDRNLETIKSIVEKDAEIKEKVGYVMSIKGIGFLTAVTVLAETDGFANITSRKQLASFAGLDVVAKESGTSVPRRHISKKGNTHIRRILYTCATSAATHNPQMRSLYSRIRNKSAANVALTAIMRKLLLLAYTLCKTKQKYDPTVIK